MLSRSEQRQIDRMEAELAELRSLVASLPGRKESPPRGSMAVKWVKLADALYRDHDSDAAVVQSWDGSAWTDTESTIDITGDLANGYFFSDAIVPAFRASDGKYHSMSTGAYTAQGTAAANISQSANGNVTVTQSRGTVTATSRLGSVSSGDLVQLSWDDDEKKWYISDAECGA